MLAPYFFFCPSPLLTVATVKATSRNFSFFQDGKQAGGANEKCTIVPKGSTARPLKRVPAESAVARQLIAAGHLPTTTPSLFFLPSPKSSQRCALQVFCPLCSNASPPALGQCGCCCCCCCSCIGNPEGKTTKLLLFDQHVRICGLGCAIETKPMAADPARCFDRLLVCWPISTKPRVGCCDC